MGSSGGRSSFNADRIDHIYQYPHESDMRLRRRYGDMPHYSGETHLNVGTDIPITEFAQGIGDVVGWDGQFTYDNSMPDGAPRKRVNTTARTELGWTASISLREGIAQTYEWCLEHEAETAGR